MKFSYESKYEVGDTVYLVHGWTNGIYILERKIFKVLGQGEKHMLYQLASLDGTASTFHNRVAEHILHATREDAEKYGEGRKEHYAQLEKDRINKEIEEAKVRAKNRIADIEDELEDEIRAIKGDE